MKTRLAILGGGVSALAAAYEIKRADPSDTFDITIYQMGWRLGGKCASSRNLSPGMDFRNEEHGLHVLGGWYHNTFEMMRSVYAEWNTAGLADATEFETSFLPFNGAVLFDQWADLVGARTGWRKLAVRFPPPRGEPATNRSLYVRLNEHPSDLYIFSPARSVEHRMRSTQSGFSNLLLCGDWVRNGTDLGWVEGAVTSARQCSRALTNRPSRIYGETDFG
jgi:uncharacterized protein with NAD-binding domain and iron-sulfur cluster